jgi:hypothetical protein
MRIGIIVWGSLKWDPRNLAYDGSWRDDGPSLPIEFARISGDGRLTLVLHPGAAEVRTLWTLASHDQLERAIENLRLREGTTTEGIGFVTALGSQGRCAVIPEARALIKAWAREKNLDAAIWTDLPSNFAEKRGHGFTDETALTYLRSLRGPVLEAAREYIVKAPSQVRTRLRQRVEADLGWTAR